MERTKYSFWKKVDYDFEETINKIQEELKKEGFGVLADLDFQATLKTKLNVDFRPYRVLAACNPPNAYKALQAEDQIGLFLPCNVIVYVNSNNEVIAAAIDPVSNMSIIDNEEIRKVAEVIQGKLKNVIEKL